MLLVEWNRGYVSHSYTGERLTCARIGSGPGSDYIVQEAIRPPSLRGYGKLTRCLDLEVGKGASQISCTPMSRARASASRPAFIKQADRMS